MFYTCFPHAFPCYSTIRNVPMLAWEAVVETPCFPWSFDLLWNPWFSCFTMFFQHEFFMDFPRFFYLGRDGKSIVPGEGGLNVLHKIEPNTKSVYILLFFIVFCWWVENIKAMIVFCQFGDYGVNERSLSCILKNINLVESKEETELMQWTYSVEIQ